MKPSFRSILIVALVVAAAPLTLPTLGKSAGGGEDEWMTNYKQALQQAKSDKKVVLADFTGSDWCPWCVKLKKDVFSTPEFKKWAKDHLVLLEVDFPHSKAQPAEVKKQNKMLQQKFKSNGFPSCVFISSSGKVVGRIDGYQASKEWIQQAKEIVKKAKD